MTYLLSLTHHISTLAMLAKVFFLVFGLGLSTNVLGQEQTSNLQLTTASESTKQEAEHSNQNTQNDQTLQELIIYSDSSLNSVNDHSFSYYVETRIDAGHTLVAKQVDVLAHWLDRWIAGDDIDDFANGSHARIRTVSAWEERQNYKDQLNFKLKIDMPKTQHRFKLFISGDVDEDNEFTNLQPSESDAQQKQSSTEAALQFAGLNLNYVRFDFRLGLKSDGRIKTTQRTRYRFPITQQLQLAGVNDFYWLDQFGYGWRLRTELDYLYQQSELLRWYSVFDFNEVDQGVPWQTTMQWSKSLTDTRLFAIYYRLLGQTRPQSWLTAYGPGMLYRQSLGKPWFFIEGELRHFQQRIVYADTRRPTAAFFLRFELMFDHPT